MLILSLSLLKCLLLKDDAYLHVIKSAPPTTLDTFSHFTFFSNPSHNLIYLFCPYLFCKVIKQTPHAARSPT